MKEKMYHNPNVDLYDIEFDLNNRWERLIDKAHKGKFDVKEFYSLCADTHQFIAKYDKCYMIPKASLVLVELLQEFYDDDWFLEERRDFFYSANYADCLTSLLIDGITENDSTDNYDMDYELCERWDWLFDDVCNDSLFDLKLFQDLAGDTFEYLKEYDKQKMIPHATLKMYSLIRRYAMNSYGYLKGNKEAFVAREIAEAFESQMTRGLKYEIDDDLHPIFIVEGNGKYHIDALSFDLTEAVKNCPEWVTDEDD